MLPVTTKVAGIRTSDLFDSRHFLLHKVNHSKIERYIVKSDACGEHSSRIQPVDSAFKIRKIVGCCKKGKKKAIPNLSAPENEGRLN